MYYHADFKASLILRGIWKLQVYTYYMEYRKPKIPCVIFAIDIYVIPIFFSSDTQP